MKNLNEQLPKSWEQIYQASAQAIEWVNQTRDSSKRLHNEADNLILDLRRLRNSAKRLGDVSTKSVAVGFFGLSQAGKSYLISALAAGENGKLETVVDNEVLDFIDHVNPVGGGKEATGLVTRFSRTAKGGIANYPLELKLFQEIEIVKILINAYFKDFDQQKVINKVEFSELNQLIQRIESKKQADYTGGITEDDIVDLYDYLSENFGNSLEGLKGGYWEKVMSLLPYLSITDRGALFSVLWGGISELTAIYIQLATTLLSLNHVNTIYAPLTVLVKDNGDGTKSQIDSIMNVDMLERLNTKNDSSVTVTPLNGVPTSISLAQLAFLTAELIFPLVNQTRVPTFENVDLLDFPGYRGRLNLISISDVKEGNPIAQLLLRGKVAYLFEKYTDSQEMNVLVVCTPSDKQSDVNDVGPVLQRWIDKTQGETADKRATKKAGLLWAITMFDKRIGASLSLSQDNLKNTWGKGGLLQQTILERFGSYDWLSNWSNDGKFNNVFLVRKPGFDVPFLNVDAKANIELSYNENYRQEMLMLKNTFVENPDIQEYVNAPDQAWDAMLKLNDGGIGRISQYLEQVAITEVKQQRIVEQLNEQIDYIINMRFDTWYQADSDEELGKKKQIINNVVKELQGKALLLGELLKVLELPDQTIRALYHSSHMDNDISNTSGDDVIDNSSNDFGLNTDFELFPEVNSPLQPQVVANIASESKFAKNVFTAWLEHLRNIVLDKHILQFFSIDQKALSFIVEELITGANRLKLDTSLTEKVLANENVGSKRDDLESRQVSSINMLLADFIAWLGFIPGQTSNIPVSRVNQGKPIFSSPLSQFSSQLSHPLPVLDDKTKNYSQFAIFDWFIAFATLAQENVGHHAGREISQEQNSRLGEILTCFKESQI
ncbi:MULTISPECIES: putative virulence factor [unclassified Gilliamella]|uniref:putative virulence factor n=1 Tax=unclassified Gilliamella TaxID=2685620 RepID=UPI0018DCCF2F|nr:MULTISPECIES: virulence factor SrfC family protein [unclassified Gilliamella]MBI0114058.1 putative virulence factor [Gilliamella sp. W8123]MBI0117595.1 putative virulence factor [Gilliamella sp. W8129]